MRLCATRLHDFSAGHRVVGHEGKCRFLHGHNYRVHFTCTAAALDVVGRVIDFSEIKRRLCQWLEDEWDHRFLVWSEDPLRERLVALDPSVVVVPFNPTAENMAQHLMETVAPACLSGAGVAVAGVTIEETRKCRASATL